jgi:hypothetical protein
MRKLPLKFIVAAMMFLLVTLVFFNKSAGKRLHLEVPNEIWVRVFFEAADLSSKPINELTREAKLPNLRTTLLPENDLEVRIWNGFGAEGKVHGIFLRRSNNKWAVIRLYSPGKDLNIQYSETRREARSGSNNAWSRLVSAGILTLQDAPEVECGEIGKDAEAYVIEVNANQTYRTYHSASPETATCEQAKQLLKIVDIIAEEFGDGTK